MPKPSVGKLIKRPNYKYLSSYSFSHSRLGAREADELSEHTSFVAVSHQRSSLGAEITEK